MGRDGALQGEPDGLLVPAVQHRVRGARVEAVGGEESDADVACPKSVARTALTSDLLDGVHGEAPRTLEPALVAGSPEGLQQRVAVARRAVAEAGSFPVGAGLLRELRAGD